MSKPKHTPGPWTAAICSSKDYYINSPDSRWVANVNSSRVGNASAEELGVVDGFPSSDGEVEANARLIAAAPELLEMLKLFARMNTRPDFSEELNNAIIDARSVIRKATGGDE